MTWRYEMATGEEDMTLQTVFIPLDQDEKLRERAAKEHVSPSDIIRRAIENYMSKVAGS